MVLKNSNIFPLQGTNNRFNHLATVTDSLREYMYFIDTYTGQTYIEEITGGHLSYIEDENLVTDIELFLHNNNVHATQKVSIADSLWRANPLSKKFY